MIHPDVVGCDVSKHFLDLYDARSQRGERILNQDGAIAAWIARLIGRAVFVVFEATGAYDRRLRHALAGAGVAHARVNPSRARDFARAAGYLAKTDAVDARMLARLGAVLAPAPEANVDFAREALASRVKRRDQLVKMRMQERVRLSECDGDLSAEIEAHIAWLDRAVAACEAAIAQMSKADPALAAKIARLKTAPGVGQVTATVLASLAPELGARSPKAIAALAGLAPLNADSGEKRGQRRIRGGRRRVREALYMAAVSAIRGKSRFAAFYARLRQAGKSAKQAIIAVARKLIVALNAMLRDNLAYAG